MTTYIQKDATVDAVKVPYNEWGDNPLEWPETPDWLNQAFIDRVIQPEFKGEDYWYYNVTIENVGIISANPDFYIIKFPDGSIAALEASVFRDKFAEVMSDDATSYLCAICDKPITDGDSVMPMGAGIVHRDCVKTE